MEAEATIIDLRRASARERMARSRAKQKTRETQGREEDQGARGRHDHHRPLESQRPWAHGS